MTIFINLIGLCLIFLIIWWFWLYKPRTYSNKSGNNKLSNIIEIIVKDGVYSPANIEITSGQTITLRFKREDASPCAEIVNFNSLNISRNLPLNQPTDVMLNITNPGEYEFTCQMGMYRGKLIAK